MQTRGPIAVGVVSTPGDPQMGTVINGIAEVVRQRGGRIVNIAAPIGSVGVPLPSSEAIDGWVVVHWQEGLAELAAGAAPVVTVNLEVEGLMCPTVLPDNVGGTHALFSHLIALGRRRIAFMGDMRHKDVRERYQGYLAALAEHQIAHDPALVFGYEGDDDVAFCRTVFQRISQGGLACSAIFAGHDYNAQRMIQEAQRHGYRVPEDLAVVGFDDIETAQYCSPPLTTVRQQFIEQGRAAARLLFTILDGGAAPQRITRVPTALVVRASCGAGARDAYDAPAVPSGLASWRAELELRLAVALRSPLPLGPGETPELVWPGVGRIGAALAAALAGDGAPDAESLDPAWLAACQLNPALVNVLAILETIEETARGLARDADQGAGERLRQLIRSARLRLLWRHQSQANNAGAQSTHVAEVYQWAVTTLLDPASDPERLGWVEHTNDVWACFARWEGGRRTAGARLLVAGEYPPAAGQGSLVGRRFDAAQFPPLDALPAAWRSGEHVLKILPVRTASSYWGLLALCGPIEPRLYSPTLAQILANLLDNQALQAERSQQEQVLREAYERERGLGETVRALGAPVIPIHQGVLLVPLIGAIDGGRAQLIIERVLDAVSSDRAQIVVLDLTGVPLVDTEVASALVQTARATMLLGAEVLMVGIRPEIAQSIIGLGLDLSMIRSFSSLSAALQSIGRGLTR